MKLTTRGHYGIRALLDLALNYNNGVVQLGDIAKRQEISARYLERIMHSFVTAGFVHSMRGYNGGFRLAREPKEIKVLDIIQTVEGSVSLVSCLDNPDMCKRIKTCAVHDVWKKVNKEMVKTLEKITLQSIVDIHKRKNKW